MSFFRRISPAELDRMQSEISRLNAAVEQQARWRTTFAEQAAAAAAAPATTAVEAAAGSDGVDELAARVDALAEQFGALDLRITAVATELANQLGELGNEIDALAQRPDGAPVSDEVIDGLRDSQTRLANEQARYQIAFREDLARLAEQLRRPR